MGGIEPFAAQQRPELPGLAGVGLPQDVRLVGRRELPTTRALDNLRIRRARLQVRGGTDHGPIGCRHDPRSFSALYSIFWTSRVSLIIGREGARPMSAGSMAKRAGELCRCEDQSNSIYRLANRDLRSSVLAHHR